MNWSALRHYIGDMSPSPGLHNPEFKPVKCVTPDGEVWYVEDFEEFAISGEAFLRLTKTEPSEEEDEDE